MTWLGLGLGSGLGLVVVLLVTDDLGCHVAVGAGLGRVLRAEARRDAKVGQLDVQVLVEQHVGRLVRVRGWGEGSG